MKGEEPEMEAGCFYKLFWFGSDVTVTKLPELPFKNLTENCYQEMFGTNNPILGLEDKGKGSWSIPADAKNADVSGMDKMFGYWGTPSVTPGTIYYYQ